MSGEDQMILEMASFRSTLLESTSELTVMFKKEAEGIDRRLQLPEALEDIDGFTNDEKMKVGSYICKDSTKVYYFFYHRPTYVRMMLNECSLPPPYHPNFEDPNFSA